MIKTTSLTLGGNFTCFLFWFLPVLKINPAIDSRGEGAFHQALVGDFLFFLDDLLYLLLLPSGNPIDKGRALGQ
jgi:hypothetical protein